MIHAHSTVSVRSVIDSLEQVVAHRDALLSAALSALARADSLRGVPPDTVIRVAMPADIPHAPWFERALFQTLVGGALALLGGMIVESLRTRRETVRKKKRLIRRIRSALEVVSMTSNAVVKAKDGIKEINAELMNGIIVAWQRYDRVSDEIGLLGDPKLEGAIDHILELSRALAEAVLEDERRYRATVREVGKIGPTGIEVDPSILAGINESRKQRIAQFKSWDEKVDAVLDEVNARWKSVPWYEPREAAEAQGVGTTLSPPPGSETDDRLS